VNGPGLPSFLHAFPGAVLRISAHGGVIGSNRVVQRELGDSLVGASFADLLDPESSGTKWDHFLAEAVRGAAGEAPSEEATVVELVLRGTDSLPEPRSFALLPDRSTGEVWLMELPVDPRMSGLREAVVGINSELANTQRDLVKERGRLSGALAELREQYAATERLAARVQEQNRKLAVQNANLQALANELRRQGEELARSNRDLDEFAHAVSHDLKAPLRSIGSYASWLEEDLGPTLAGESREHLQRLQDRTRRMREMIDGVLTYARAGRDSAEPENVEVDALLASVLLLLDPPPTATVEIAEGMPTLISPRAPLQQVFLNLLSNALQHARAAEQRIRVEWREIGDQVEFTVSDNGQGVPPAQQKRVWELFHTGGENDGEGTGIGLAVVRRLVEGVGGSVGLESPPGEGARFHFTWPRRVSAPASAGS
jgi:signal transduction histidine kinase